MFRRHGRLCPEISGGCADGTGEEIGLKSMLIATYYTISLAEKSAGVLRSGEVSLKSNANRDRIEE
jgi:hypothetical protein